MTTRDFNLPSSDICSKCGSRMIDTKIPIRKNGSLEWQKVQQCIICKHWHFIDKEQ
jgi:hypothetical protein